MAHIGGSASIEIDAPLDQVWAVVDVLTAPEWQGGLVGMSALEQLVGCRRWSMMRLGARRWWRARATSRSGA